MFYAAQLVSRDGPLQVLWVAATLDRQLNRQLVDGTAIAKVVDVYLKPESKIGVFSAGPAAQAAGQHRKHKGARGQPQLAGEDDGGDAAPLALRLSGQLLLGVCRIYSRKVVYLLQDCERALLFLHNICPDEVPLAFGGEHADEAGWAEGVGGAGSEDHDVAEGEGRKPKSRKRATATRMAAAGGGGGMTADGLAPLVLPYDEDEILLAGSSQSRRASEAQGNSAVEEGAGGGTGLLLGRLGSGFGSGALDDQLGTPGAGSPGAWATPGTASGGRGTDTGLGMGAPGAEHDYFDDAVPEHFEFDLDEEELEGLRLASQAGMAAQQHSGKDKDQHAEELQEDAVRTPRRPAQEGSHADPQAAAAAAPGVDSTLTERRQVLSPYGEIGNDQEVEEEVEEEEEEVEEEEEEEEEQEEEQDHGLGEAPAATPPGGRKGPLADEEAAATAAVDTQDAEAAECGGWGQPDPNAGGAAALSLGTGSGVESTDLRAPLTPGGTEGAGAAGAAGSTELSDHEAAGAKAAGSAADTAGALGDGPQHTGPQATDTPATRRSSRKVVLSPGSAEAEPASAGASPRPRPRLPRSAPSPRASITLDVTEQRSTKGDTARAATTLPTALVRDLLQDRSGLIDHARRNAARRRATSVGASAGGVHASGVTEPSGHSAAGPWLAVWGRAAGVETVVGLQGACRGGSGFARASKGSVSAGPGAPALAEDARSAGGSSNSSAGHRQLDLAAGPVTMPLAALAPPLQQLFRLLVHGGEEQTAAAGKTGGASSASGAPPAKRARKSQAVAAPEQQTQQLLDAVGAENAGGGAAAATTSGSAGAPAKPAGDVAHYEEDEDMPPLDLDMGLEFGHHAAGGDAADQEAQQPETGLAAGVGQDEDQRLDHRLRQEEEQEEEEELDIESDDGADGQQAGHTRKVASDGFTARTRAVLRRLQALAAGARRTVNKPGQSMKRPRANQATDDLLQVTTATELLQLVADGAEPTAAGAPDRRGGAVATGGGGGGVTRMAAARTFYDLLVLTNRGYISLAWAGGASADVTVEAPGGRGRSQRSAPTGTAEALSAVAPNGAGNGELVVIARRRLDEQAATKTGAGTGLAAGQSAKC